MAGSTLGSANSVTVNGVAATRYSDGTFVRSGVTVTNGDNTFTATATDALGRSASTSVSVNLPGTAAFQCDLNGNLLSDGLRTFDYDDDNQLVRVTVPNKTMSEFVYDGRMRRRINREYTASGSGGGGAAAFVSGVTLSSSPVRNNFDGWVGMKITVGSSPVTVSELGRWVTSGNSGSHTVKLVAANGSDIPGASVSVSTAGASSGQFKYATLSTPVTLTNNTSYYVVSQEFSGGDAWYDWDSVLSSSSVGTINCAVWVPNNSTSFAQVNSTGNCYVPVSFRYGSGSTTWALASETHYVYDGMLPVQERDANNIPLVTYTRGKDLRGSLQRAGGIGGLLARTDNGAYAAGLTNAHAYYHADGSGNVTMLIDGSQRVAAQYSYDPFGNTLAKAGPLADANTYRFSSKEFHTVSGNYYYGYRWYVPNLQRWLNRDPIGENGGQNLYRFGKNNSIVNIDSLGLMSLCFSPDSPQDFIEHWRKAILILLQSPAGAALIRTAPGETITITPGDEAEGGYREIDLNPDDPLAAC